MIPNKKRTSYIKRWSELKAVRDPHLSVWRIIADHVVGYQGRHLNNKGKVRRNNTIMNNTAKLALRTLAGGMMSGITSPARPWFRLSPPSIEMMEDETIKEWLHEVEKRMREVFSRSNFYNSMHTLYRDVGAFATSAMGIYPDNNDTIHCQNYPIGSYCLSLNGRNNVDSVYREYVMTVGQVVKEFCPQRKDGSYDTSVLSQATKHLWETGGSEKEVTILHVVEPNDDRDMMKPMMSSNMPYRSMHMEKDCKNWDKFLRVSGNMEMPIITPRWDVYAEDPYGYDCPAIDALGDTKALQLEEKRKAQALDKVVNPPLQAPVSMLNQVESGGFRAGEVSFVNDMSAGGIKSIYDLRPDINALAMDIQNNEYRVKRAFYEDLFMMLANSDRRQITAREVEEKHEEKLLMLGSVLERLHHEGLDPIIDRVFAIMNRKGMLPPPPEALQGQTLRVEYISVLAQAQKMTSLGTIERLAGYVGQLSAIYPDARHKFDAHQSIDEYADALGVSPKVVVDDDEVEKVLAEEAQQMQMQQALAMAQPAQQMSQAVKSASEAQVGNSGQSALDQLAGVQ